MFILMQLIKEEKNMKYYPIGVSTNAEALKTAIECEKDEEICWGESQLAEGIQQFSCSTADFIYKIQPIDEF